MSNLNDINEKAQSNKALIFDDPMGSFLRTNFKDLDRNLSPEQKREWTNIYASFRSRHPLRSTIVGVDTYKLPVVDPETQEKTIKSVNCLVVMEYRVKVLIPEPELWFDPLLKQPDYVIHHMIGTKIDYVVTNVDRVGECAIGSRKMAMSYNRYKFFNDKTRNKAGSILPCTLLVVGPKRLILECCGFDMEIGIKEISYTAIADLRDDYIPGQEVMCKLLESDAEAESIRISVKEVNPNPFEDADIRHPPGSKRQGIISGTYAGGLFCRLSDDTTILCLYSPGLYGENVYDIKDRVLLVVTSYNYEKKVIYGKILTRI